MILSYSRMKFCYFSREPFTTKKACEVHDFAFQYFGGRTQTILYDQVKVFLVSENYGDFILTNEFESYVRDMGFTVNFCHKHDPQSKAKVENTVWSIKHQFLDGRIYTGKDALNGECLEWLDRFSNGDYNITIKKIPRDMFKTEYPKLTKVKIEKRDNICILTVKQKEELLSGMRYCLRNKKCSVYEISSYLVYKYGIERARVYLHDFELSHFKKRAIEIKEELENGSHK